ncbi:MAG: hypothetical protein IH626_14975 [Rhodospirillales bacterium]|nr:hypothetical protein [Rhodospirillales bacterium]
MTAAGERSKRYRTRLQRGVQVVTVEVDGTLIEALLAKRLITPDTAADRQAIAAALRRLALSDGTERIRRLYG